MQRGGGVTVADVEEHLANLRQYSKIRWEEGRQLAQWSAARRIDNPLHNRSRHLTTAPKLSNAITCALYEEVQRRTHTTLVWSQV